MSAPQLLTVLQAAARLGVSDDTIRVLVAKGKLSCVRVGIGEQKSRIRFTEEQLAAYVARQTRTAPADKEYPDVSRVPHRRPRRSLDHLPEASRYA